MVRSQVLARISAIAAVAAVFCGLLFYREAIASTLRSSAPAGGDVLIYTDNSPGSIVPAGSMQQVVRESGYATTVVTDERECIKLLPAKKWALVVAVTRYSSAPPAYSDPLRNYVAGGGWAQIYRWRDDPKAPAAQGSVVLAPAAVQVWKNGFTLLQYSLCTYSGAAQYSGAAKSYTGYMLGDFADVQFTPCLALKNSGYDAIASGEYKPLEQPSSAPATPKAEAQSELNAATKAELLEFTSFVRDCMDVYSPRTTTAPANPDASSDLLECQKGVAEGYVNRLVTALRKYMLRMTIAERKGESQQSGR